MEKNKYQRELTINKLLNVLSFGVISQEQHKFMGDMCDSIKYFAKYIIELEKRIKKLEEK